MSHYDTLGIAPDADEEAVKKAFRKKASAAHPDREGGSDEAMKQVNRAYAVLSDPARRAAYDRGETEDQPVEVDFARDIALNALRAVMDVDRNFIAEARDILTRQVAEIGAQIRRGNTMLAKLKRRRELVRAKEGHTNLAHMLIDQAMKDLQSDLAQAQDLHEYTKQAILLVDGHECDEQQFVAPKPQFIDPALMSSAMWTRS